MASALGVVSVSSCVPEVAIRRFCIAKLSRLETCLRSMDSRGTYGYLAIPADHRQERNRFTHAQGL